MDSLGLWPPFIHIDKTWLFKRFRRLLWQQNLSIFYKDSGFNLSLKTLDFLKRLQAFVKSFNIKGLSTTFIRNMARRAALLKLSL